MTPIVQLATPLGNGQKLVQVPERKTQRQVQSSQGRVSRVDAVMYKLGCGLVPPDSLLAVPTTLHAYAPEKKVECSSALEFQSALCSKRTNQTSER